jgi:hypothetical protein
MFVCLDCGQPVRGQAGRAVIDSCPSCGAVLAPSFGKTWVDVARVSNLAEAGFLSDELIGMDIEARVFQSDDFGHADGGWKTSYLIRVPAELAQQAAAHIRSHVAEAAAEADEGNPFGYTSTAGPADPAYWRPVAVIVLAGVASFVLGRQSAMPEAERRPARDPLAAAVNSIGRPLVTESIPGEPQHRLWYHRPSRTWRLETDQNGDGIFEHRRQFQTPAAGVR